jgi:hypothetical protein
VLRVALRRRRFRFRWLAGLGLDLGLHVVGGFRRQFFFVPRDLDRLALGRFLDRHGGAAAHLALRFRISDRKTEAALDRDRYVFVDGAGMSLLFLNTELRQELEYPVWLDFQLPRQLIDSDFQLHR